MDSRVTARDPGTAAIEGVTGAVLLVVLGFAPLWFGAVQRWAWGAACVAIALAALGRGGHEALRRGVVSLPAAPLLLGLGAVGLFVGLQQVALPAGLAEVLVPGAAEVGLDAGWAVLSLDRPATFEAMLLGGLYAGTFGLAAVVAREPRHARWVLFLLVGLGTFEAFYGLVEQLGGDPKIFGYAKPITGRTSGTYVNPNHYAAFLAMAISVALGLSATTWSDAGPLPRAWRLRLLATLTHPAFPRRALLAFLAVVMAVALAGSLSRGGVLSCLAGALVVGVGTARIQPAGTRTSVVPFAVLTGVAWTSAVGVQALLERFGALHDAEPSVAGRLVFVYDTVMMAFARPLTGVGAGAFEAAYPNFQSADLHGLRLTHAHSDYAELLAELGFVAFVVLLVSIAWTAWSAWPRADEQGDAERRAIAVTALGALAPLVLHSFVDFNLRVPANALWAVTLLGVGWGVSRPDRVWRVVLPARAGARGAVLIGAGGAALVLVAATVQLARSDWTAEPFVERAQEDPRPLGLRIRAHEEALALWPFRADHHAQLGVYRFEVALERRRRSALEVARDLVDVERTPEREVEALAALLFPTRLAADPSWPAEVAGCLDSLERAMALTPGSRRWREISAELVSCLPQPQPR